MRQINQFADLPLTQRTAFLVLLTGLGELAERTGGCTGYPGEDALINCPGDLGDIFPECRDHIRRDTNPITGIARFLIALLVHLVADRRLAFIGDVLAEMIPGGIVGQLLELNWSVLSVKGPVQHRQ